VLACGVVAAASTYLSDHYGAPVMLIALLLGLAMNFLSGEDPWGPGIEFTAKTLLRIGVALLGLRITIGQVAELGWQPIAIVVLTADPPRSSGGRRRLHVAAGRRRLDAGQPAELRDDRVTATLEGTTS
jgi:hypothetical protein